MKYDWEYVSKEFQTCKNKKMQKSEFQNHVSFLFSYGWKWKDSFVIGSRIDSLTNNRKKGTSSPEINAEPSPMVRTIERQNYSRWGIYSVNEREGLCKNQAALELVKVYLRAHPEATYFEIDRVFNSAIPDYVLTKENRDYKIRHSSDSRIATRWHDETLMSADGIAFCVTTQIGNGCRNDFQRIVELSEKLGCPIKLIE